MPPKRLTLVDTVRAEQASDKPKCGHTCRCHGDYVCIRTVHDHYGNHWVGPDGAIAVGPAAPGEDWTYRSETRTVHAGWLPDGELVTWSGPHMTDEQIDRAAAETHAAQAAAAQAFRDLLAAHPPNGAAGHLSG